MFNPIFIVLLLFVCSSVAVLGQSSNDGYKKTEVYVGYSNGQVDSGADSGNSAIDFLRDRENFNGANVSAVYNLNRYFGIKGDVSGTFNKTRFSETFASNAGPYTVGFNTRNQLYNFTAGVQVKDNSRSGIFKPFAHVLVGVAHSRTKVSDFVCSAPGGESCSGLQLSGEKFSGTGVSGIIGGGIDLRVSDRIQIRAIQIDYNPTRIDSSTSHNLRFGAGIVF